MDKIICGLDLPNDVVAKNMEILTKELGITDEEINSDDEDGADNDR